MITSTCTTVPLYPVTEEGGHEVMSLLCSDDIPRAGILNTSYKEGAVVIRDEITTKLSHLADQYFF